MCSHNIVSTISENCLLPPQIIRLQDGQYETPDSSSTHLPAHRGLHISNRQYAYLQENPAYTHQMRHVS